jgi:hypothetical protein
LPDAEPRPIPEDAIIHRSVVDRIAKVPSYRPINLPASYAIEEGPTPPLVIANAGPESPNAGSP